jgi:hypothetical protein
MKCKSLITISLLFVLSFSIVHEYIFASMHAAHGDMIEYVNEFKNPTAHGDICDAHSEYHQAFVLEQVDFLANIHAPRTLNTGDHNHYQFYTNLEFFKPPIV